MSAINDFDFSVGMLKPIDQTAFQLADRAGQSKRTGNAFEDFYRAALDMYNETNANQITADRAQLDLATGRSDNVIALIMAQQRAQSSLSFTVQMTNRVIEAYREIMRMQL